MLKKNPNLCPRKNKLVGDPGPASGQRSTAVFDKRHKPAIQRSHIEKFSGGLPILDTRSSFTPEDAYQLFTALGNEGRLAYRFFHLIPDTLFPISYSLAFAFISAWFLVRLLPLDHTLQWLSLIPLISGLADVLENLSLVFASLAYPGRIDWLVHGAFLMNRVKFGLLPIGLVFLIVIVVIWFIRKRPGPTGENRTR